MLPDSASIENNNPQLGNLSMLDAGSESKQEIHPINATLLRDVLTHFWQQIDILHPSGCPSEKWGHMVPGFDLTDMRLRFAHRNVSHVFRQPPHNGYTLTELVHNFLRGDAKQKKKLQQRLFLFQTALPTSVHLGYTRAVSPLPPKDAAGTPEVPAPVFHPTVVLSPALPAT